MLVGTVMLGQPLGPRHKGEDTGGRQYGENGHRDPLEELDRRASSSPEI